MLKLNEKCCKIWSKKIRLESRNKMIDLHIHTTCSDGTDSPAAILKKAEELGAELISVSDHNSVEAYGEIMQNRDLFSGKIITGVELTSHFLKGTFEILGYGFDTDKMRRYIKELYSKRITLEQRFMMIHEKYRSMGLHMRDIEQYPKKKWYHLKNLLEDVAGSEYNRKFLYSRESVESLEKFFRREINNIDSPLHVEISKTMPAPETLVKAVHDCGGLAFVAHIFVYHENVYQNVDKLIEQCKPDGFECFYTRYTEQQTKDIVSLCKDRGLYMCGGSDYHGGNRSGVIIGTGSGNLNVHHDLIYEWAEKYVCGDQE